MIRFGILHNGFYKILKQNDIIVCMHGMMERCTIFEKSYDGKMHNVFTRHEIMEARFSLENTTM